MKSQRWKHITLFVGLLAIVIVQHRWSVAVLSVGGGSGRLPFLAHLHLERLPRHPIKLAQRLAPVDDSYNLTRNEEKDPLLQRVRSRAFAPWPKDHPLPCFPPDGVMTPERMKVPHDSPVSEGFFFLKTFKTASSTSAGVNLRIARNVARRRQEQDGNQTDFHYCKARFEHGKPWNSHGSTLFGNRTIGKSFLWAILRHPTRRAISQFFHFKVSRWGVQPTDENFQRTTRHHKKNYYVRSLSLKPFRDDRHDGFQVANEIIQDYDFIGVSERIDESFVALSMLLRLPLSDILYLSAKLTGEYDGQCTWIQPSFVSPGMQDYFQSDYWKRMIQEDLALYVAANRSLDLTIDRLGRSEFQAKLAEYQTALEIGQQRCAANATFPCTRDGVKRNQTSCLWKDSGCGASCLDQVAVDLGID